MKVFTRTSSLLRDVKTTLSESPAVPFSTTRGLDKMVWLVIDEEEPVAAFSNKADAEAYQQYYREKFEVGTTGYTNVIGVTCYASFDSAMADEV